MKQDKQPTTSANLRRYSHDLSFQRSWTSSTGHIIPVVHDFLNAGETIQCSIDLKTRMQPIARPAMMDIHQKIKYFFVPMDMIYSLFGSIRYQVNDFFSSRFDTSDIERSDGFPIFDFKLAFTDDYKVDASVSQWSGARCLLRTAPISVDGRFVTGSMEKINFINESRCLSSSSILSKGTSPKGLMESISFTIDKAM